MRDPLSIQWFRLFLAWLLFFFCLSAKSETALIVGSEVDYPPYALLNERGEADGFSVDLIKEVAKVTGLSLRFRTGPWPAMRVALEQGDIDVLPHVAINARRAHWMDFATVHTVTYDAFFVRHPPDAISPRSLLQEKTGLVMNLDAAHDYLLSQGVEPHNLILTPTFSEALKRLASGEGDYALLPHLSGILLLRELGIDTLRVWEDAPLSGTERRFAFAVSKGREALLEKLNQGLRIIQVTGEYERIYQKWFAPIKNELSPVSPARLFRLIADILLGTLLIFLVILTWVYLLLKRRFRRQTDTLKKNEQHLRRIFETPTVGIALTTPEKRWLEANNQFCRMLGYTREELADKTWLDLTHPDDVESSLQAYEQLSRGEINQITTEKRYLRRDGSILDTMIAVASVRDAEGKIAYFVSLLQDIGPRKQAEQVLQDYNARLEREVEERIREVRDQQVFLRQLMDTLPQSVMWKDLQSVFMGCNRQAATVLNLESPAEIEGRTLEDFIPPQQAELLRRQERGLFENRTGQQQIVELLAMPNGREMWSEINLVLLRNSMGHTRGLLMTLEDITTRKQMEQALQESEAYWRRLIEEAAIGLVLTDMHGGFIEANRMFLDLVGYTLEELRELTFHQITPSEYHQLEQSSFPTLWQQGRFGPLEKEYLRKNGTRVPVRISGVLVQRAGQAFIWGNVENITAQIETQKALGKARDAAETASQAKSAFLANMSHEIRTPMNAVLGFSDLLYREIQDERHRGYIEAIRGSGRTLLTLLNDILDFSKIEAGMLTIQPTPTRLASLFEDVRQMFWLGAEEKGLAFELSLSPDFPARLWLDEVRLRQVLCNLVGNALKFTETGYIHLIGELLSRRERQVDLLIRVRDTGRGISPEALERVFEAFNQQEGEDATRHGGAGLGLSISRGLVESMNGQLKVQSTPGQGSIFEIHLWQVKLVDDSEPWETTGSESEESRSPPCFAENLVLIADEVESNRYLLTEYLEPIGLHSLEARDDKELLCLARQYKPALILVDFAIRGVRNGELVKLLAAEIGLEKSPLILMNAASHELCDGILEQPGFVACLRKPLARETLYDLLAKYLPPAPSENKAFGECLLPEEQQRRLNEAVRELDASLPLWEKVIQHNMFDEIADFGHYLLRVGNRFDLVNIIEFGETLIKATEAFDVPRIHSTLGAFPELVESLRQSESSGQSGREA